MTISLSFNASNTSSTAFVFVRGTALVIVESFIFLILNIAAFVGNLLVCMAFYRNPSLRTVTGNFVVSLAVTDLLMATAVMPFHTISSLLDKWVVEETVSPIVFYCLVTLTYTSGSNVMLIAINRYFRVVRPKLYGSIYSRKSSALMAAAAWIITTVLVGFGFPLFGIGYKISESNPTVNRLTFSNRNSFFYSTFTTFLYIGVPSFVVSICYVKVYQTIRRHNTPTATSIQEGNSSYGVEEAKITRLLTAVVAGYYLCSLPAYVTTVLFTINLLPLAAYNYIFFMRLFPIFISSVINPIVYGVMNQSFQSEFLKIVRCR